MKSLARQTNEAPSPVRRLERHAFGLLGNRREGQNRPIVPREHMTNEIILMQALHDDDDAAGSLVVEAR
jgi:hypothetical protein